MVICRYFLTNHKFHVYFKVRLRLPLIIEIIYGGICPLIKQLQKSKIPSKLKKNHKLVLCKWVLFSCIVISFKKVLNSYMFCVCISIKIQEIRY